MEKFIENFTKSGELTPLDIVMEITGLTEEEIAKIAEIIEIDTDEEVSSEYIEGFQAGFEFANSIKKEKQQPKYNIKKYDDIP